jgi:uncharacterized SAM-binding protein YcdF (DUF218 family)
MIALILYLKGNASWIITNLILWLLFFQGASSLVFKKRLAAYSKRLAFTSVAMAMLGMPVIPKSGLILFSSTESLNINQASTEELSQLRLSNNITVAVLLAGFTTSNVFDETPSSNTLARTLVGIKTATILNATLILSGGHTKQNFPSEALVAAKYFKLPQTVLLEEESLNTYQSAKNIAKILDQQGRSNLVLVTDEIHLKRAIASLREQDVNVVAHAIHGSKTKISRKDFIPQFSGFGSWRRLLHEVFATAYYMLTGKISSKAFLNK